MESVDFGDFRQKQVEKVKKMACIFRFLGDFIKKGRTQGKKLWIIENIAKGFCLHFPDDRG